MDWSKGFSASYYATFIDPKTWRDTERFEITGGSVKRFDSGLRCSADVNCVKYDQSTEKWVRIYLDAAQTGSSAHVPLFTGLATAPESDIDGNLFTDSLVCYSVLKSAQDILLPLGYYAQAGVKGADLIKQLLSEGTPAPVTIIGDSPQLSQYIIAESNENNLSMAEKILAAINWRLRLKGDGSIELCGLSRSSKVKFDPLNNDSIEPQLRAVNDWYSCPNVFRAIMGNTSAVARDDSLLSPLSTINRGREIWREERDCKLANNEGLAEYAKRRLKAEQRHYLAVSYTRRFHPDIFATDWVNLHYPAQSIAGDFYILSQEITLGYGASTSEEVIQV